MNKVPRKVWKKEVILSWKSLENCSQISVRTLIQRTFDKTHKLFRQVWFECGWQVKLCDPLVPQGHIWVL